MARTARKLIKTLLRFLFPRNYQVLVNWLYDLTTLIKGRPNETHLAYWAIRKNSGHRVMIDVGAHYGGSLRRFAQELWKVYAFEPDPVNRERLIKLCRNWSNVSIDSRAVSNEEKSDIPLYHSDVSSGISGISAFHPSHKEITRISTVTLDHYCQENGIENVDILKVDTEGHDLFVLQSISWENIKPRIIITEFEDRKTIPLGYTFHDLANYLIEQGYLILVSEWFPVLEYGTNHKWRAFAMYPAKLKGGESACGNLIAALDGSDMDDVIKAAHKFQVVAKLKGHSPSSSIR